MKKKENIETVFAAALHVFAEYGFKKATVEDIARELGMTKGNLYLYVRDKKDLYERTVAFALQRWQGHVREAMLCEPDVARRFEIMCRSAVEYLAHDGDFRKLLVRDPGIFPMFPENDPYAAINENSVLIIKKLLKDGMGKGRFRKVDAKVLPRVFFLIYKLFIIMAYVRSEDRLVRRMLDETMDLITMGLYKKTPSRG
jgi:AcrR family transcriptional regulator